jgi:hypothetical protein
VTVLVNIDESRGSPADPPEFQRHVLYRASAVTVSLSTAEPDAATEVSASGYARREVDAGDATWPSVTFTNCRVVHAYVPMTREMPDDLLALGSEYVSEDASRYDATRAEAEAEMAEWRAILDGAKGCPAQTIATNLNGSERRQA